MTCISWIGWSPAPSWAQVAIFLLFICTHLQGKNNKFFHQRKEIFKCISTCSFRNRISRYVFRAFHEQNEEYLIICRSNKKLEVPKKYAELRHQFTLICISFFGGSESLRNITNGLHSSWHEKQDYELPYSVSFWSRMGTWSSCSPSVVNILFLHVYLEKQVYMYIWQS